MRWLGCAALTMVFLAGCGGDTAPGGGGEPSAGDPPRADPAPAAGDPSAVNAPSGDSTSEAASPEPQAEVVDAPVRVEVPESAFTHGTPIRLDSLDVEERSAGGGTSPSPAIADAAARAAMDATLAAIAAERRSCEVSLALERLVAVHCVSRARQPRPGALGDFTAHLLVGEDGIERVSPWSLFLPGLDDEALLRLVLHTTQQRDLDDWAVAFSRTGLDLLNTRNLSARMTRIPWRHLAPYLRADTPIGEALAAEGLSLAPVGSPMPALPPTAPATWVTTGFSNLATMVNAWGTLPPEHRDQIRLVTPGGDYDAALVYPPELPDADARRLHDLVWGISHEIVLQDAYRSGAAATVLFVRAREAITTTRRPGAGGAAAAHLPEGTLLPAVRGRVHLAVSDPTRGWTYVGHSPRRRGWVSARSLARADCVPADVAPPDQRTTLRGITTWAGAPHAWFVRTFANGRGHRFSLHSLEGCTTGPVVVELDVRNEPVDLYVGRTAEAGGEALMVVVTASSASGRLGNFEAHAIGPRGDVSQLRMASRAVELGVTTEAGWVPVRLGRRQSVTWTGASFATSP